MKGESKKTNAVKPDWKTLKALCQIHSTPGDEGDAAAFMKQSWEACGWKTSVLGRYAITAKSPQWIDGRPTVLLCAHLDSPGLIIQQLIEEKKGIAIPLGGVHMPERKSVPVLIKGRDGLFKGAIMNDDSTLGFFSSTGEMEKGKDNYVVTSQTTLHRGDRICFAPHFNLDDDGFVNATFLDNRIGCWALIQTAKTLGETKQKVNVVLAATGEEEMTGFGADVLAGEIRADLTVCLDATYVSPSQDVDFHNGPVLTVCDKSTLLSPAVCRAVEKVFDRWHLPLQEEIYNYSGTDSRAFPKQAIARPVLALLLATEGNHSDIETASVLDAVMYEGMCLKFCTDDVAIQMIADAWDEWGTARGK